MATPVNSMKSVLRAHNRTVNGITALGPDLDDALTVLQHAHAVLVLTNLAREEALVNSDILRSAFDAAESLLATGVRYLAEGHEDLLRSRH